MAVFVCTSADVSSWTGSPVADSKITWQQFTLNYNAPANPYLTTSGIQTNVPDITDWSGSITGFLGTPNTGVALAISHTSSYASNCESWGFNYNVAEERYVVAGNGGVASYLPGAESWTANATFKVDDAEPIVAPGLAPSSLVLTSSSGNTITGNATATSVSAPFIIGGIPQVTYNYAGSGTVAIVGSNNITAAASPLTKMSPATLTLKGHEVGTTDVQFEGSAFWTQLAITAATSGLIGYTINFRGTGALTISDPAV